MGKQLSIYLADEVIKRLNEIANKECRRPNDQVRYILLSELGLADKPIAIQNTLLQTGTTPEQI
jgi:hypothetical protein